MFKMPRLSKINRIAALVMLLYCFRYLLLIVIIECVKIYVCIHYIYVYFESLVQLQTKETLESKYAMLKFMGIL